ncbi:GtrA family protein [Sphingomonas sp. MMS24-JH45]
MAALGFDRERGGRRSASALRHHRRGDDRAVCDRLLADRDLRRSLDAAAWQRAAGDRQRAGLSGGDAVGRCAAQPLFRDHGTRDNLARTGGRFFLVSLVSFGMNTAFVGVLTGPMGGPTWWPLVPIVFVTPLVTFALNRLWVFA